MNSGAREALTYAASLMHVSVEDVLTVGVDSVSDARDSGIAVVGALHKIHYLTVLSALSKHI